MKSRNFWVGNINYFVEDSHYYKMIINVKIEITREEYLEACELNF